MTDGVAVVLDTPKSRGQDWATHVEGPDGCRGFVVCDGVGSWEASDKAARAAASTAREVIKSAGLEGAAAAFAAARDAVQSLSEPAGTTMMLVVNLEERVHIGYVGNGAILHLNDIGGPHKSSQVVWTNYLLPHASIEAGRELTTAYTSERTSQPEPTWILLERVPTRSLFMGCTDGVHSREQVTVGQVNGSFWEARSPALSEALAVVKSWFQDCRGGLVRDTAWLQIQLAARIAAVNAAGGLDDDVALAVLSLAGP